MLHSGIHNTIYLLAFTVTMAVMLALAYFTSCA